MRIKIAFKNLADHEVLFRLEPWADEQRLLPGESLTVNTDGPNDDTMEVEIENDVITMYGWTGSICEIER